MQDKISHITNKSLIIVLIAAILSFLLYEFLPYDSNANKGLAILLFIAILWLTEAIHITITALLVPVLGVLLGIGISSESGFSPLGIKDMLINFANPTIFLFFGGFALATALHVQKLDVKIAMKLVSLSGAKLGWAVVMICAVTAVLSMWISNTATAAMMIPLAIGMISHLDKEKDRGTIIFVMLGIAYSASIGGLGTLVGSPPNAIASAELGYSFFDWMKVGLPLTFIFWPLMLFVLYILFKPDFHRKVDIGASDDTPWTRSRIITIVVFILVATCWIFSSFLSELFSEILGRKLVISDALIALIAAILVVVLGLCSWDDIVKNTEWGVLMLFGGGLTLSAILKDSGASLVLGNEVANALGNAPDIVIIFIVALFIKILTEFTSNTASAALLVPVFADISMQIGMPKEVLVVVIGVGASCAFMLPVATPPNALVFGTGMIKQKDMVKAGFLLDVLVTIAITLFAYFVLL